jgi:thiamine-phosphate pyrophosphorylase
VALPRVLVFTDADAARQRGRSVLDVVSRMLHDRDVDGAAAVVVRAKTATEDDVAQLAAACAAIARRARARVLVHTHARLVGALGLDGVHLDRLAGVAAIRAARLVLPPGAWLGVSRHIDDLGPSATDVPGPSHGADGRGRLRVDGADYATLSPIFSPSSKPNDARPRLGPEVLYGHHLPVFALGGIDAQRARLCLEAGAAGVAVLGGVMGALRPRAALDALLAATAPV